MPSSSHRSTALPMSKNSGVDLGEHAVVVSFRAGSKKTCGLLMVYKSNDA